jgi:hypothetical protein
VLLKDKMFLLHLGAPEGTSYLSGAPKWRRNILSFRCTSVEKEHLILPEHLSEEGRYYPSVAPKWRRNILSFRCT